MRLIFGFILAMQLAQGGGQFAHSEELPSTVTPTVTLSQEAWSGYQFYLLSMGAGTGAFAVSPDGLGWGFSYCATGDCTGDNQTLALAKCKERAQFNCLIFALNDRIQVKYTLR